MGKVGDIRFSANYIRRSNPRNKWGRERLPVEVVAKLTERVIYLYKVGGRARWGCVSRQFFDTEYIRYDRSGKHNGR